MSDLHQIRIKYIRIILVATISLTVLGIVHWELQSLGAMFFGAIVAGYTYQAEFRGRRRVRFASVGLVVSGVIAMVLCTCLATFLICNVLDWSLHWRNAYCSANLRGMIFNISLYSGLFVLIMTWAWYRHEDE